jgi:hypothetical protein
MQKARNETLIAQLAARDAACGQGGRMMRLTEAETRAMDITVDLVAVVCQEVIGHGPTRDNDVREFVDKVHQIQATIMAQAAGRAHPDRYRLLGETLSEVTE